MEAPLGKIASEDVRAASGTAVGHGHPSSPPIQLPDAKADFLQRQQNCAAEMVFLILGLRSAVEQEEILKSIPKHRYIPGQDFPAVAGLGIGLGGGERSWRTMVQPLLARHERGNQVRGMSPEEKEGFGLPE